MACGARCCKERNSKTLSIQTIKLTPSTIKHTSMLLQKFRLEKLETKQLYYSRLSIRERKPRLKSCCWICRVPPLMLVVKAAVTMKMKMKLIVITMSIASFKAFWGIAVITTTRSCRTNRRRRINAWTCRAMWGSCEFLKNPKVWSKSSKDLRNSIVYYRYDNDIGTLDLLFDTSVERSLLLPILAPILSVLNESDL